MRLRRRRTFLAACLSALAWVAVSAATGWTQPAGVGVAPIPHGRYPTNHGAALVRLPTGNLLACWYSGLTERGREAGIICSQADANGNGWSAPSIAVAPGERAEGASAPNKTVGNVVLSVRPDGAILMIYGVVQSRVILGIETCGGWPCGRIDYKVSRNNGQTWGASKRLDDREGALPRSRPIRIAPSVDMLAVYREGRASSILTFDTQKARTARLTPRLDDIPSRDGLIQPALARNGAGKLFAYLRDQKHEAVFVSSFDRAGSKWSPAAKTNLPNPGSALDALTDGKGRVVLVHNASSKDRNKLSLSISEDGKFFPHTCTFIAPKVAGEIAYPSVAELDQGRWGVVFSYATKREIGFAVLAQDFIDQCWASRAPSTQ